MTREVFELGKRRIHIAAKAILKALYEEEGVVLIRGELASGKTTLVKKIAKLKGIKEESVSSPTFSMMNYYVPNIFHYDIYQSGFDGMLKNGLFENLQESGLHLIEWADEELEAALMQCGIVYIVVEVESKDRKRVYRIYKNA